MSGAGRGLGRDAGCGKRDAFVRTRYRNRRRGPAHCLCRCRCDATRSGWRSGRPLARRRGRREFTRPMSPPSAQFPIRRMRRLRRTPALRRLVQETHIAPSQLIWPLFVAHGEGLRRPVVSLPGVAQLSVDQMVKDAERAAALGLGGIILFGIPATKDATGSEAYDDQGIVQQAIRAVKRAVPDLLVIGDVCLCEYTDHGHCGVMRAGEVDNDASVYRLGKASLMQVRGENAMIQAAAGPGMLDETRAMWESVTAIRRAGADIILTYFAPDLAEHM